ncbi:hypothetical protein [Streptomyces synnematoformans]|uniref:Uncharacterized protein n=1 Tax=Streptomyces synnematoformans TaxID=415721 RepID=A0ABN2XCI8_9ACTN
MNSRTVYRGPAYAPAVLGCFAALYYTLTAVNVAAGEYWVAAVTGAVALVATRMTVRVRRARADAITAWVSAHPGRPARGVAAGVGLPAGQTARLLARMQQRGEITAEWVEQPPAQTCTVYRTTGTTP